ncbi:MAG: response regulator [Candidatus Eiseniibacteriota bacterium]|nr:MAG: response regulator [Candidatus Eisenbacteria bacterium]
MESAAIPQEKTERKKRILVADDDPRVVELLQITLTSSGYEVLCAADGAEALELATKQKPDLVILDVKMPKSDGFEVCESLKKGEDKPCPPVILISGQADASSRLQGLLRGADDFLIKPFSPRELLAKIERILKGFEESRGFSAASVKLEEQIKRSELELERVNSELKRLLYSKDTLISLSQQLNSSLRLETLLDTFLLTVVGQLRVESACFLLAEDWDSRVLVPYVSKGVKRELVEKLHIPFDSAFGSTLASHERPLDIDELESYPEVEKHVRAVAAAGFILCHSIHVKGRFIGVLLLGERVHGNGFTPLDMEMLTSLSSSAGIAIENARLYNELQETYLATIKAFVNTIEAKDPYTRGHTERVAEYATAIGEGMGLPPEEVETIRFGATLHDIGKLGVYEQILWKPTALDEEEWRIVKSHPETGASILCGIKFLEKAIDVVRHHHERLDGRGYPDALNGDELSLNARIVCVADSFDAMTSDRPYRDALPVREAIAQMEQKSGTQFDPKVTETFARLIRHGNIKIG